VRAEVTLEGGVRRIEGPLLFLERQVDVGLQSTVEVIDRAGRSRIGRVAALDFDTITVEVLESTLSLGLSDTRIRIEDEPLQFGVGPGLLGRTFDSVGRPTDGGGPIPAVRRLRIDGLAINPAARALPRDFIETGVTTIDLMNSLVRGQKLPIFSGAGLPHERLATQIALEARLRSGSDEFAIVFVGLGVSHDTADNFREAMAASAALDHTAMFLNLADEPAAQRLLTPRYALTAAEYLAFVEGRHVLCILTDMTNYCEALREVSASHAELPSRKGYPGYMYSDLASLYERAGCIRGLQGTLTQLPILTMPGDDIGHPIPDLTGYITEGQIVLDRELDRQGIYPPVRVLPSLSRLMNSGIGVNFTHADHPALANQLFASYARAMRIRLLASVMGEESLPEVDRRFLAFGREFERQLVSQRERRTLEDSMQVGWALLRALPASELSRLSSAQIERYLSATRRSDAEAAGRLAPASGSGHA
jgi:V/A-type H+/Na+-transporting ATPase subunit B